MCAHSERWRALYPSLFQLWFTIIFSGRENQVPIPTYLLSRTHHLVLFFFPMHVKHTSLQSAHHHFSETATYIYFLYNFLASMSPVDLLYFYHGLPYRPIQFRHHTGMVYYPIQTLPSRTELHTNTVIGWYRYGIW